MSFVSILMPYKYSKCGTAPVQVYIDIPLDTPEFAHLSDAEQFLAKIAALVAHGQLDFQAGQNLSALAKNWIDAQYAREELAIKQYNAGAGDHEQVIRVEGGLPRLPGSDVIMPVLDGHANGHETLAPPVPQISSQKKESVAPLTNGQGSEPKGDEPA